MCCTAGRDTKDGDVVTNEGEQPAPEAGDYGLVSRALGGLPIVNHFLDRLGVPTLLGEAWSEVDGRTKLAPAAAIRLVITNLVLGRGPLYALGEWAARYDPALLGLSGEEVAAINDDRVGRALDALFDADRASLLTAVMLAAISEFSIDTDQLHNDSTSISVHGAYRDAEGSPRRGKATPVITFGHSKDHRPDLLTELREVPAQHGDRIGVGAPMVHSYDRGRRISKGSRLPGSAVDGVAGRDPVNGTT